MNVCFISSRFYPQLVGSGTSAYVITKELQDRGHQVTVLTDESLRGEASHAKLAFSVEYIKSLEDFATGKAGFRDTLGDLYGKIKATNPDIVHVCNFMPMLLVSMIRSEIDCPIVFTFFNTPVIGSRTIGYFPDPILENNLGSFIIKSDAYDMLILGSSHYMDTARALGARSEKLRLSYLAPDVMSFEVDSEVTIDTFFSKSTPIHPYILLPSRITEQKGIIEAIEALSIINSKAGKDYKLLLTGMASPYDVAYADMVWKKADELEVRDYLLTPEKQIDRDNLAAFFKGAELVVVPSWYEGLGLAAIEAQYLGAPLAVSDTTGLNEIVENGKNGLTFKPRDSVSMANTMLNILERKVDIPKMTEEAKKTVQKFSLDKHILDIEDTYKMLAAEHQK